jgi:hypothetical protein
LLFTCITRDGNLYPRGGSLEGLAPVECRCGSEFTPMGAPAPDPGWQWARVSIHTHGSPLAPRLQPIYYNFGSRNPQAPETRLEIRGHSIVDTLSKPVGTRNQPGAGTGAVFHSQVRVQVRVFTCQHFRVGRVFGQPAPLPSLYITSLIIYKGKNSILKDCFYL